MHYCFFNLGGRTHELAVKEVALYLWMKYSASHQVRFVTVPFERVVEEILSKVENSQMGVVLKRMMLRAASQVAASVGIEALVTGESVAQVSSQTLANLAVIDSVSDMLVLRPLISSGKQDIIDIARQIGTEEFSRHIPEYCGVISNKPTTRARPLRIARQEEHFDMQLLDEAVTGARVQLVSQLAEEIDGSQPEISMVEHLEPGVTLIDIRHPDDMENSLLTFNRADKLEVLEIPFYQLQSYMADKDRADNYVLYCDKGMMSRLHAAHLVDLGFENVAVYQPARAHG